jgi:2,5-diketo-D-gluconate reductase B
MKDRSMSKTIPQLGLGTFGRTGPEGLDAISAALELGYRHIDTAQTYDTEGNVGEAIRRSDLPRDELFVTTKISDQHLDSPRALNSVETSLETLGLDHVDLLLIHWPSYGHEIPMEEYLTALAEAQDKGWAALIGVSNFTIDHLKRTADILGKDRIATNQVEIHPYLQSPKLNGYMRETGLTPTAYQPLAKGQVAGDKVLAEIGRAHGISAAATSLAFLMGEGYVVIPASSNRERLAENLTARGVTLTEDEMSRIRGLDRGARIVDPEKSPDWDDK